MVRHIMKDGQVVRDLKGHIVKMADAKEVYSLIDQMNRKKQYIRTVM